MNFSGNMVFSPTRSNTSQSLFEESRLNEVQFSNLDLTEVTKRGSTMSDSIDQTGLTSQLSVAAEQEDHDKVVKVHESTGLTGPNTNNHSNVSAVMEEVGMTTGEEQSVVSVDDGGSTLQEDVMGSNICQNKKLLVPQETIKDIEIQESCVETDTSQEGVADESDFFQQPLMELGRRLWKSTARQQHYTKGCLWSPDGTCVLVPVHLDGMHIIELPADLYTMKELPQHRDLSTLPSAVHVKEGGTVYDCVWYPFMNSSVPETCCWLATRQHEPIHMWDAFSGELRCSYRGYDDVDEVESAISLIFRGDGQKVLGGYKKSIKIFDTNIPGRDCASISVKQAVSCFALTADNNDTVTAGSWNGYINHFDLRVPKLGSLFTLGGHSGGITWLRYGSPSGGYWQLFSGARKDSKILQWDMRNYTQPVRTYERTVSTNQRIYFDLSPQQRWLVSGDTEGLLRIWDISDASIDLQLALHSDCCNGVNFHPNYPILASSAGQYHFVDVTQEEDDLKGRTQTVEKIVNYENSLILLWFGRTC